jgi:hypothetical protein
MGKDAFVSVLLMCAMIGFAIRIFFNKVDTKGEVKQAVKQKVVSSILKRLG